MLNRFGFLDAENPGQWFARFVVEFFTGATYFAADFEHIIIES